MHELRHQSIYLSYYITSSSINPFIHLLIHTSHPTTQSASSARCTIFNSTNKSSHPVNYLSVYPFFHSFIYHTQQIVMHPFIPTFNPLSLFLTLTHLLIQLFIYLSVRNPLISSPIKPFLYSFTYSYIRQATYSSTYLLTDSLYID